MADVVSIFGSASLRYEKLCRMCVSTVHDLLIDFNVAESGFMRAVSQRRAEELRAKAQEVGRATTTTTTMTTTTTTTTTTTEAVVDGDERQEDANKGQKESEQLPNLMVSKFAISNAKSTRLSSSRPSGSGTRSDLSNQSSSIATLFANTMITLPSPWGQFAALPHEIFEIILHSILAEALAPLAEPTAKSSERRPSNDALRGIRSLAQVNQQMKLLVQREVTHFFSRSAAGLLGTGYEWWIIAQAYNELRLKGFGMD